jgi:L-fuculose-phosphate aldolase
LRKIPIVQAEFTAGSKDVARLASEKLREYKIVILRGHGVFSSGPVLEEAFEWCSVLEESARVIYLNRLLQMAQVGIAALGSAQNIEYRKHTEDYKSW